MKDCLDTQLRDQQGGVRKDLSCKDQLPTQNTSNPLVRYYQQQPTVRENKSDSSEERNQEEALEVDRRHIEESIHLRHKQALTWDPQGQRKTKEHITSRNGDRDEKNEQQLNGTRKEGPGQSGL
ncbi:unnamed protein product [Schistosoma mattheei]|uniref:Uncharacterized protein n=1 Tax=Schistosoma mattheei TaxID=31246 RepID=A0A183NVA1_9TREM|nr:unnamed protein product [Schistosoma mattheei]